MNRFTCVCCQERQLGLAIMDKTYGGVVCEACFSRGRMARQQLAVWGIDRPLSLDDINPENCDRFISYRQS